MPGAPTADLALTDWIAQATSLSVERFTEQHPYPFLFGTPTLRTPRPLAITEASVTGTARSPAALRRHDTQATGAVRDDDPRLARPRKTRLVLPIRKRTDLFREMISVGRAPNNDVVVPDVSVSKFHAYFRVDGESIALIDAASRNGTRVDGVPIAAKVSSAVRLGARIELGDVALVLVGAEGCWNALRRAG